VKLESQVKKLRQKHDFKVIAVAGSVGKTSTKLAVAQMLGVTEAVRYQDGNYNDRLTVPLIFFGEHEPSIFNVWAWFRLLRRNARALRKDYPYTYVVVELGTDGPGQLLDFAYLEPDITVITAVAAEHMEYFKTLDTVAAEELSVAKFSKKLIVNVDDIAAEYLTGKEYVGYALDTTADYRLGELSSGDLHAPTAQLNLLGKNINVQLATIGKQGAKISLAAAAVADQLDYDEVSIQEGLAAIKPVPGRMQILAGKQDGIIIDDTYNASPLATKAALDVLYATEAPQRIAILGSMNELGDTAQKLHEEVGEYCDPKKLAMVVTIGKDAKQYLAPAAEAKGCKVMSFDDPNKAGAYVAEQLQPKAVVLAKGSQNGVFAEEAIKKFLANPDDARKLVRQSGYWMKIKAKQFPN